MNIIRDNEKQLLLTDSIEFTMNNEKKDPLSQIQKYFYNIFMPKRKQTTLINNNKTIKLIENNNFTNLLNKNYTKKLNLKNITTNQLKNKQKTNQIFKKQFCSTYIKNKLKLLCNLNIEKSLFNRNKIILNETNLSDKINEKLNKNSLIKNEFKTVHIDLRIKRNSNKFNALKNINNLKKLNNFIEQKNYCENFIKKLSDDNSRFLNKFF